MARSFTASNRLFEDVIAIMDSAAQADGAVCQFQCETVGLAIRTLQKMHQWRIKDRARDPTGNGESKYDAFIYSRSDKTIIVRKRPRLGIISAAYQAPNGDWVDIPLDEIRPDAAPITQADVDAIASTPRDPYTERTIALMHATMRNPAPTAAELRAAFPDMFDASGNQITAAEWHRTAQARQYNPNTAPNTKALLSGLERASVPPLTPKGE
jgi:hypothetical protein